MKKKRGWFVTGLQRALLLLFVVVLPIFLLLAGCKGKKELRQMNTGEQAQTTQATVPKQLPVSDPESNRLFADHIEGTFELPLFPGDISLETGEVAGDGLHMHSALLTVPNRLITADAGSGYNAYLYQIAADGTTVKDAVGPASILYLCQNARWAFIVERTDKTTLTEADEVRLVITVLDPDKVSPDGNGLWTASPFWGDAGSYGESITLNPDEQVSAPLPLSDGGLGVLFGGDETTAARFFRIEAIRLTDEGIVPAEEETLRQMSRAGQLNAQSLFLPAAADSYVVLILDGETAPDLLTLTGGTAAVGGENRLYGLFNMTVLYNETENGLQPRSALYYSGNMADGQDWLGALLRTSDVTRIRCDARYELIGEYWSPDADGVLRKARMLWAGVQPGGKIARGQTELVPSAAEGEWLLLCVHRRAEPLVTAQGQFLLQSRGMGGMRGYDEVSAGVIVEYTPGRTPECVSFEDPAIAQNYSDILSYSIPYVYASKYQSPQNQEKSNAAPAMFDFSGVWYSGTRLSDTLLHNISPRSYLTAALNPNSRYYRYPYPIGYGSTCINFVTSVLGLTETYSLCQLFEEDLLKFDRTPFDMQTDVQDLMAGDLLVEMDPVTLAGHAVMIKDVIRTGGAVSAVTVIEGYPPFSRQRTFYFIDASGADSVLLRGCLSSTLGAFICRLRVKPEYIRLLRDNFDMAPDISVGSVMCDRGSDSVYCMGAAFAELSVTDAAAEALTVCCDGKVVKRLSLRDAGWRNGCRVVRIESLLTAPGIYTVFTDRSDEVQERFYVPEKKNGFRVERNTGTALQPEGSITILAASLEEIDSVFVYYKLPDQDEEPLPEEEPSPVPAYAYYVFPREQLSPAQAETFGAGWGQITVPAEKNGRLYSSSRVLYRTPYGTFWIAYGKNGLIQTAESTVRN